MPKSSCSSEEGYKTSSNMLADCDGDDRMGFVRKVYSILAVQLFITFGFVAFVKTNESVNDNITAYSGLYITCLVLGIAVQCTLVCCMKVARSSPVNYILLTVFTLCWTFIIGYICALYNAEIVMSAALMTAAITMALTTYAMFTKNDFTTLCGPFMCWGLLVIITVSMMMSILSMLVFSFTETWYPFAAGFGVIIYGLFLLIDTQLVCGGGRYSLTIDDYIVGALILYLDIVMIFLELLKLFGNR